ncbi:MAG: hypothetical protein AAF437_15155 [Pseudomonadota bacterium]
MQWLIANMWIAMAAATVLGLLFGFAMRGLMVGNRIRKAEVEREIAKTELTQSKAEVEALYAAQRKRKEDSAEAVGGGDELVAALDERERRISTLGEELASAQAELEALKSQKDENGFGLETAGAAVAGAVAGVVLSDGDQEELVKLRDRNAWLEDRVGTLETEISNAEQAPETVASAPVVAEPAPDSAATVAHQKTEWQASYLRTRVDALEAKLIAQAGAVAPSPQTEIAEAPVIVEPAPAAAVTSELDEELAQLRWRNRYLEGRLAYFEQAPEEDEEAESVDPIEAVDAGAEASAEDDTDQADEIEPELADEESAEDETVTSNADAESEAEPEPEPETDADAEADLAPEDVADVEEPEVEADVEAAEAETDVHPSEAMLAELEGKQPVQVDRPSEGGDDLTTITGIGPRIAEVLNGLGIWTFAQIADWQPENETWIENHLSFKGRVSREDWVGQAKELLVAA